MARRDTFTPTRRKLLRLIEAALDAHRAQGRCGFLTAREIGGTPDERAVTNFDALIELGLVLRMKRRSAPGRPLTWVYDITPAGRERNKWGDASV